MATETLAVNLLLNATQYKTEARQAATATGQISNSAGTATTATGKLDKQMSGLATTAKFAIAGAATAAVVGFAKDSVQAASDLTESVNAVNVTFGKAADGVLAIGENAADSFGMSQSAFNQFAVRFSAFATQIAEQDGRSIVEVVDEMAGRVADFASVHNLSLEEAARVAQSTLAGETEVFRRFGGDVSAATVQQYALENGVIAAGESLTEQQKILIRHRLFMEQTDKTAGDFKNTQDDLANATRTLSANWTDFQALIGGVATGALGDLVATGGDLLTILNGLGEAVGKLTGSGTDGFSGFVRFIEDSLFGIGQFKDALSFLAGLFEEEEEAIDGVTRATEESIGAANRHRGAIEETGEAAEDTAGDTDQLTTSVEVLRAAEERQERASKAAREALLAKRDALREIHDPLFRVVTLNGDLEEAEKAVEEASKKGVASQEYRDAVIDRAKVIADLETTLVELKTQGIDPTGAAARLMLADLGIPEGVINEIFGEFDRMQADFEGRTFRMQFLIPTINGQDVAVREGSRIFRQHGGPVHAGQSYVVGEAGPEMFIPSQSGQIISNEQMTATTGGLSGPTYVFYGDVYGDEGFMRKVREANVQNARLGR